MKVTPETVTYQAVLDLYAKAESANNIDVMRACVRASQGDYDSTVDVCDVLNRGTLATWYDGPTPPDPATLFFTALDSGEEPLTLALFYASVETALHSGTLRALTPEEAKTLSAFQRGRAVGSSV